MISPRLLVFLLLSTILPAQAAEPPNFLIILADDLGYSDIGAFGGEIDTPNLDRLASEGLRLTNMHVAPTCSPTRAMLLTGVDHHRAGIANMGELITKEQRGRPGYEGHINDRVVTVAALLRDSGYRTLMSGKWHLGAAPAQDPTKQGFDRAFALLEAGHNHYGRPNLPPAELGGVHYTENGSPVTLPENFYSSDYFTDKLLQYLREDRSSKPFFAYLPFTAPHWPLHAPPELIRKYQGRYDAGWTALRHARIEGQRRQGVLAANADPSDPPTQLDWNSLSADDKARQARKMEIYAAMIERMDANIGRVLEELRTTGQLDNTVVVFLSDNGAAPDSVNNMLSHTAGVKLDIGTFAALGSIDSMDSLGPQWAQASTAPYRLFKSVTSEGGLLSPTIIRYPAFARQKTVDGSFATVLDLAPTLLELAGAGAPAKQYQGKAVEAMTGRSMLRFLNGKSSRVHLEDEQFGWELFGQRALHQGRWKLTYISRPNGPGRWELFDLSQDPGERRDLSAAQPAQLKSMIEGWNRYARRMGIILQEQPVSPYDKL